MPRNMPEGEVSSRTSVFVRGGISRYLLAFEVAFDKKGDFVESAGEHLANVDGLTR
jgi:hypothetical protein